MNKRFSKFMLTSASALALLAAYPSVASTAEVVGFDLPAITAEAATQGNAFVRVVRALPSAKNIKASDATRVRAARNLYNSLPAAEKANAGVVRWAKYLAEKEAALPVDHVRNFLLESRVLPNVAEINAMNAKEFAQAKVDLQAARASYAQLTKAEKANAEVARWAGYLTVKEDAFGVTFILAAKDLPSMDAIGKMDAKELVVVQEDIDSVRELYDALSDVAKADAEVARWVGYVDQKEEAVEAAAVLKIESVRAINAKTLKVVFNTAVDRDKAKVEVKRGTVKPNVKEVKFADDNKSATIEFNTNMFAGDYTVTVTGLTEEALTGTVKVETEKLATVEFLSDVAVISGNNITTNVIAKNQYGEEINSKLPATSVSVSKGVSPSINNKGVLTVVGGGANVFKVDDKVVITVVDSTTGVTATKTLTVAKAANVDSINVEEIKTDDTELAKKELNVTNYKGNEGKYYFPVVAKDQYGNDLTVAQLNGSVTVTSSNKAIVNPGEFKEVKGKAVLGLKAAESGDTQTHGTAVLTFVAASTGKTATVSVTVKEDAKLDVVTLEGISLIQNVASELPITIVDTYGEEVNLFDVTVGGNKSADMTLNSNTTIKATGAKLEVKKDLINKTAKLEVTPSAKNVTLQVVSATGKPQVLTLTAEEAPVVTSIKGLDKDFVSLLANDVTLNTDLKSAVEFTDQYGEKFAVDNTIEYKENETSITKSYYMIEEKNDNNVTTFNKSTGVITASANAGNETYTVTLKDKDKKVLDTFDVTITVVDANKITSFGMNDLDKFYTKTSAASTHTQQVKIYGLHNNRKVVVNQNMIQDVYASNGLTGFTNKGLFTPANITTNGKDMSATLNVLVANKANTYTLTKDVVYSDADRVAETIVAKYNNKEVTGAVQVTAGSYDLSDKSAKLHFLVKDQYGKELTTGLKVVGTNATNANTKVNNDNKTLEITAGESIQLNARINGKSLSIKVLGE